MVPQRPQGPPPAPILVLVAYRAGKLSADEAAPQFLDALRQSGTSVNVQLDRPFREAVLRIQIAEGTVPPDTVLGPDE